MRKYIFRIDFKLPDGHTYCKTFTGKKVKELKQQAIEYVSEHKGKIVYQYHHALKS
jgi:hypothetical protein